MRHAPARPAWIATLILMGGLAADCSSSTAPADPFIGQWQVSVANSVVGDTLKPDTFVVAITKTQGTYHMTFPTLTATHNTFSLALSDTAAASGFTGHGDSMFIALGSVGLPCYVSLAGTVSGGTAAGSVILQATSCTLGVNTIGTWAALKQ